MSHPPRFRPNTIAITHVAEGEVGGATNASPIGTPPRRVGVAPPTVGLSNGGRPGNRAMVPTNEEASGQEKKPLPPEEKVWLSGPARRETVCSWQERWPVRVIGAFCLAVKVASPDRLVSLVA